MLDYQNTGISVIEMSHRSPEFGDISRKAKEDLRKFLDIPDNFEIFFFQGGATM
jgi:phosphoserine aminotransferase